MSSETEMKYIPVAVFKGSELDNTLDESEPEHKVYMKEMLRLARKLAKISQVIYIHDQRVGLEDDYDSSEGAIEGIRLISNILGDKE